MHRPPADLQISVRQRLPDSALEPVPRQPSYPPRADRAWPRRRAAVHDAWSAPDANPTAKPRLAAAAKLPDESGLFSVDPVVGRLRGGAYGRNSPLHHLNVLSFSERYGALMSDHCVALSSPQGVVDYPMLCWPIEALCGVGSL